MSTTIWNRPRKVEETQQKFLYVQWINQAHHSVIMVYARDKLGREIARAIRPEVSKMYIVGEFKDAIRLIDKYNGPHSENHRDQGNHSTAIDLIVADADYSTAKILEHLQKRAEEYRTGHLPIIPVVLLIPETIDPTIKSTITQHDFSTVCVNSPYNAGIVLDNILESLHRKNVIENTYKKIRRKTKQKDYPFIPVFVDWDDDGNGGGESNSLRTDPHTDGNLNHHNRPRSQKDQHSSKSHTYSAHNRRQTFGNSLPIHTSDLEELSSKASDAPIDQEETHTISTHRQEVDPEVNEWMDFPGLLPKFLQDLREGVYPPFTKQMRAEANPDVGKEQRLRRVVDKKILKTVNRAKTKSGTMLWPTGLQLLQHSLSSVDDASEYSGFDPYRGGSKRQASGKLIDLSGGPAQPAALGLDEVLRYPGSDEESQEYYISSSESDTGLNSLTDDNIDENDVSKGFYNNKADMLQNKLFTGRLKHLEDVRLNNRMRSMRDLGVKTVGKEVDIRPFIGKHPPDPTVRKTVVGMNRKVAEECWKIIHTRSTAELEKDHQFATQSTNLLYISPPKSPKSPLGSGHSSPTEMRGRKNTAPALFSSAGSFGKGDLEEGTHHLAPPESGSGKASTLMFKSQHFAPKENEKDVTDGNVRFLNRLNSVHTSATSVIRTKEKAVKTIKKMAAEVPQEGPLHSLMALDVTQRKISAGEWVYLEQGLRHQEEGDFERAINSFTRAIKRSKQPQLPMICRGGVYFQQRNYLAALNEFTAVIKVLRAMSETNYNKHDDYIAKYDRGIVHFCLGDDANGLADLRAAQALDLDPIDHVKTIHKTHATLAAALRRLNRFDEAIVEVMQCRKIEQNLLVLADIAAKTVNKSHSVLKPKSFNSLSRPQSPTHDTISEIKFATTDAIAPSPTSSPSLFVSNKSNSSASPGKMKTTNKQKLTSSIKTTPSVSGSITPKAVKRVSLGGGTPPIRKSKDFGVATERKSTDVIVVNMRPSTTMSIRDRKTNLQKQHIHSRDNTPQQLSHLDTFKTLNGITRNIFETLFVRPSLIQEALLCAPSSRSNEQINNIGNVLRGNEFFHSLSAAAVFELSRVAEYRTITSKGKLTSQNRAVDFMSFILSGHVQMRVELTYQSRAQIETIHDLHPNDIFGHIDLLFHNPEDFAYNYLRETEETDSATTSVVNNSNSPPFDLQRSLSPSSEGYGGNVATDYSLPRAVQPGAFSSYNVVQQTEIVMVPLSFFRNWLISPVTALLRQRLDLLQRSGIFGQLSKFDLIRLARSGAMKKYKHGEIILKQTEKPMFLYILFKGLAKVTKRPTRAESLRKQIIKLKEESMAFDSKFSFHHSLRDQLQKVSVHPSKSHTSSILEEPGEQGSSDNLNATAAGMIASATTAEVQKYRLDQEIDFLEEQLVKAKLQDAKDEEYFRMNAAAGQKRETEISMIKNPQIFGEACILDPITGISPATITSDTGCEIFAIHKIYLQTFHITEQMILRVREHAIFYPEDDRLLADNEFLRDWSQYKNNLIEELHNNRKASSAPKEKMYEPMEFTRNVGFTKGRRF